MPSWKKVITSGSDASLSSLTTTGNISGSSTSTGSFGHIMKNGVNWDTAVSASAATAGFGGGGGGSDDTSWNDGTATTISGSSTSTGSFGSVHVPDKIGIGLTNPTEQLDVDGKIQIQGDTSTKVRAGDGGTTYGTLYSEGTTGDVELVLNSTGGASPDINFQVAGTPTAAIVSIAGSSDLRFRTNGNSTNQLIIDSSGHSTFTGNVVANGNIVGDNSTNISQVNNITALGNISGSSTSTGSFGELEVDTNTTIGGNLTVGQYIYHKDDTNTYINLTDDRLRFNIGGISYIDLNDSTSAPHDITFNDGGNNVDLTIKGSSNNPLFKTDASANRIGTHGLGSPKVAFHIGGSELRVDGNISGSSTGTGSFGHVMQDGKGLPPQFTTGGSIFIGENAGASDDGSNNRNIGIGKNALDAATTGQLNVAIGDDALTDVETGNYNVAIGFESQKDTTGGQNTSVGYNSLEFNTSGNNNVAIGYAAAGGSSYSGISNIAVGYSSLGGNNVSGDYNVAIGHFALSKNTTADGNLAIGDFALANIETIGRNVAIGSEALRWIKDGGGGYNNTALGWNAGRNYTGDSGLVTASYGVFIGHTTEAKENNSVNEIVIGSQVTGKGSNTATIGDAGITDIYLSSDVGATVHTGNVSGSSTSTGSFGYIETAGAGNVALFGDSALADEYIAVRATTNGAMFGIDASLNSGNGGVLISGGTNKSFAIKVADSSGFGAGTPEFTIDTSGNVDITSGYLKVAAGATGEYFRVGGDDNSNQRGLRFTSATTTYTGDTHTINAPSAGGNIVFQTNSTERLRIDNSGNVKVSGDIRATGDVIAENYIVSSSVTYMTSSFSSGSTVFGNSADDTHQFTGSLSTSGSISSKTLEVFSIIQPAAADVYDDVIELGMNSDRKWKFRAGSHHNGDYGSYALLLEQSAATYYGDLGINPGRGLTILKNTTIGRNLDASSDANGGLGFSQKDGDLNIVGNSQDGEINITTYAINGLESGSYLHLRKTDSSKYPDIRATDDGEHIGTIDFIGSKQYAWLNPGFIMKVSQVGAVGSDYSKNKMEIKAGDNATAPSTILTIDNTGISGSSTSTGSFGAGYIDNKLGIGTTSPGTNLHIRQKATTGTSPIEFLRLEVNDIDNVNLGAGEGPSIDFYVGEDGTSEYSGRLAVVRNSPTDVLGAGDMVFHTSADDASPSERMRIRYDGNVGIANTNPAYPLDVSGQIRVNTAGSAAAPAILINDTDCGIYDGGGNIIAFSTAGTYAMEINASQNVGIGASPTYKLDVSGQIRVNTAGSAASPAILINDTDCGIYDGGTNIIAFSTAGTYAMGIDGSQNLEVVGNILPAADNSKDLGSASKRWANIYSADVQLSNEGTEGNEVDGTTGSWTIQEGEDDLYLLNRKNGKKYRFKLEEIK